MTRKLILGLALIFVLAGCSFGGDKEAENGLSEILTFETAKATAEEFINANLLPAGGGYKANVTEITEEKGLFKLKVEVEDQVIESYMTKDGSFFFPQPMDMKKTESSNDQAGQNQTPTSPIVSQKTETPYVELFVMSHCPYGVQMEKAILPVVKTLGDKIDFELKFCDYAMHDKVELEEQMVQHCIQEQGTDVLLDYLDCFLLNSDSEQCLDQVEVSQENLNACVDQVNQEYNVMADYADKSTWKGQFPSFTVNQADTDKYEVAGSPTLIINGEEIQAPRNPNSLLETICSAFSDMPEECDQELSTLSPSPSFGSDNTSANTNASCG